MRTSVDTPIIGFPWQPYVSEVAITIYSLSPSTPPRQIIYKRESGGETPFFSQDGLYSIKYETYTPYHPYLPQPQVSTWVTRFSTLSNFCPSASLDFINWTGLNRQLDGSPCAVEVDGNRISLKKYRNINIVRNSGAGKLTAKKRN